MGSCLSGPAEPPPNPNQIDLSHFTMLKVVGKGGFGKVNAVVEKKTGELLALKRLSKAKLVEKDIFVKTIWRERNIMSKLKSPFLVNMKYAFQDKAHLYIVMPFMQGGDLRYFLTTQGRMPDSMLRFYAAELVLALEELHRLHIVYRDLKPDNILLNDKGHIRLSDYGLAVSLDQKRAYLTEGVAGTPGYQAPEVLQHKRYGAAVDYFSLGITLYELLEKQRPFSSEQDIQANRRLEFHFPHENETKAFVRALLKPEPSERLGHQGIEEIKADPFFATIDWRVIAERTIKPPHQPETDRANCIADFELEDQFFGDVKEPELTEAQQQLFRRYEFNVDLNHAHEQLPEPDDANASPFNRSVTVTSHSILGAQDIRRVRVGIIEEDNGEARRDSFATSPGSEGLPSVDSNSSDPPKQLLTERRSSNPDVAVPSHAAADQSNDANSPFAVAESPST